MSDCVTFLLQMLRTRDRMNNTWQPQVENDSQKITFYNPQQFHQESLPQQQHQYGGYQQSPNPAQMQNLQHGNYPYSMQYSAPTEPNAHYQQAVNNSHQPQGHAWNLGQASAQNYGVPATGHSYGYDQTAYQYGTRMMPGAEVPDEPIESQGDWNDIDLDREEYESSSSSEYGRDAVDQALTGYEHQGYEQPPFPPSSTNQPYQQVYVPTSHNVPSYMDSVDANIPVSSAVPPPQPLPDSLILGDQGGWHAPPQSAPAMKEIASAVNDLTASYPSHVPSDPQNEPGISSSQADIWANAVSGVATELANISVDQSEQEIIGPASSLPNSPLQESRSEVYVQENAVKGDSNTSEHNFNLEGSMTSTTMLFNTESEDISPLKHSMSEDSSDKPYQQYPTTAATTPNFSQPSMFSQPGSASVSSGKQHDIHPYQSPHDVHQHQFHNYGNTSADSFFQPYNMLEDGSHREVNSSMLSADIEQDTSAPQEKQEPESQDLQQFYDNQKDYHQQHSIETNSNDQQPPENHEYIQSQHQESVPHQEHQSEHHQPQEPRDAVPHEETVQQQSRDPDEVAPHQGFFQQQTHQPLPQEGQHKELHDNSNYQEFLQQQQKISQEPLETHSQQPHQIQQQLPQEVTYQRQQSQQMTPHQGHIHQQAEPPAAPQQIETQPQQMQTYPHQEHIQQQLHQTIPQHGHTQPQPQKPQPMVAHQGHIQQQVQQPQQTVLQHGHVQQQVQQTQQTAPQHGHAQQQVQQPQQTVPQHGHIQHQVQQPQHGHIQHQVQQPQQTVPQHGHVQQQVQQPQQTVPQQVHIQQQVQLPQQTVQQQVQQPQVPQQGHIRQQVQQPLQGHVHQPTQISEQQQSNIQEQNQQVIHQDDDDELQIELRRLELEELEIERRKKLLSLQLEEQELKARKRELLQRKLGSGSVSSISKEPSLSDGINVIVSQPSPIVSQPKKQADTSRFDNTQPTQQRKAARAQPVGNVKPSEELRQIMSNMRPSPKKPPSISRGPSRQSSVLSDRNSADNSEIMSASRTGDLSLSQYQMFRPYGMPDAYYGAQYNDNSSRAGSEYGAPIERSPSRGSNTSYEPWQQMYMQQQQAWYHHYHNNKRGDTGYNGWPFATGFPSFEQWYHAMYMQQNQAYYQWWEQYYSGGTQGSGYGMWGSVDQPEAPGRRTPRRYLTAHCAVSLNLAGIVIQVCPNRPDEGEPARVQLLQMPIIDREESNYVVFPGPLHRSETIPSDVRAFLRTKCEDIQRRLPSDVESAYLLIAYLELLIKNRGTVLGIDVVDLLLEGHIPRTRDLPSSGSLMRTASFESLASLPPSGRSTPLSGILPNGPQLADTINVVNPQDKSLDDFRKLLLCGRKRQALHYACKNSLWGHALYLAQEMGPDVLESTRLRFNKESVNPHDPIRTFYQFSSRLIPEVATNYTTALNSNWGDWRPHLAMLVANQDENPELAARSIIHLGDSLSAQQLLFAAQLCYLLAGCEFGKLDDKSAKISMISVDHRRSQSVISDEAIQLTEVYEYAMSLAHRDFCIPSFQLYKFIYATRLLDAGLVEESYKYLSVVGGHLIRAPHCFSEALADAVLSLGDRLQYHPACVDDYSRDWIVQLRSVRQYNQFGSAVENVSQPMNTAVDHPDGSVQNAAHVAEYQYTAPPQKPQQQVQQQLEQQQAYLQQHQHQQQHQHHHQQPQQHHQQQSQQHHQQQQQRNEPVPNHANFQQPQEQMPHAPEPTSYQHHNVVSQAIPEQMSSATEAPAENMTFFNPSMSAGAQPTTQFFHPPAPAPTSDSAPPSPGSINPHSGDAFDYFSSVNQLAPSSRQRTVSGSSSGGPSSPSASISLGQGAFKKYSRGGSSIGSPSHSISLPRGNFRTYTRQSPTRSRTTSVASSGGGQRSRHSSAADHTSMPPPSRPPPRAVAAAPSMDQPPPQANVQENTSQASNDPGNQKGVFKKLFGFFRPQNEVHLPDDKKPEIVWDDDKKIWVNQVNPEENTVVTAPPKLSQMPNPGEIRFRSGGISGRGAAGRYVDVLAQSKAPSGAGSSQMPPPMLPPGQNMMAPPAPISAPTPGQPQFFVPGPAPAPVPPMPQ